MTPDDLVLAARRQYNAVGDTFWADAELYGVIRYAVQEVAIEGYGIPRTYETSTVQGTQGYDFPTNAVAIKRVTWDGRKLTLIDMREDDALTALNQNTSDQGNPEFYWIWNKTIYLRPVPASVATLKIWTFNQQAEISTGTTTIELPNELHSRLLNPLMAAIVAKDKDYNGAQYYRGLWEKDKIEIKKAIRKMMRADGFAVVKDENLVVETRIGA